MTEEQKFEEDWEYDERDDEDNPYCDCGAVHDYEEEESGCCSSCGKIVQN